VAKHTQSEGLAMGAPTSSILSEFYLQHLGSTDIYDLLIDHNIVGYFRYADDILIVYNVSKTNIDHILERFNKITPNLQFTIERN
jgi:hypothetical protein